MKNPVVLIAILTIVLTSSLFSQEALKKGSYSLSGAISLSSSNNESNNTETESIMLLFNPGLSYFIYDNLALGIELGLAYSETEFKYEFGNLKYIDRPYRIGPSIRYYFPGTSVNPFIEGSVFYANDFVDPQDMRGYALTGGINIFLSKSVAIEPFVEYSITSVNRANQDISEIMIGARINYFIID